MKKTLATLIKLQKTYVDEQRQILARLQDVLDVIITRIAQLEIEKAREQVAAGQSAEARGTYGAFLRRMSLKGQELEKQRRAAAKEVEAARLRLSELFEEQKRYEIAEASRIEAEAKEERRRERIDLDEIGGMAHERRKKDD